MNKRQTFLLHLSTTYCSNLNDKFDKKTLRTFPVQYRNKHLKRCLYVRSVQKQCRVKIGTYQLYFHTKYTKMTGFLHFPILQSRHILILKMPSSKDCQNRLCAVLLVCSVKKTSIRWISTRSAQKTVLCIEQLKRTMVRTTTDLTLVLLKKKFKDFSTQGL